MGAISLAEVVVVDGGVQIQAPYHPDFVDQLKAIVPAGERRWKPDRKVWVVASEYRSGVIALCRRCYDRVVITEQRTPSWAVALFEQTPEHLHKALYLALSKALHPDTGGDSDAMKQLTTAYRERRVAA
jgi:hypothetical protein